MANPQAILQVVGVSETQKALLDKGREINDKALKVLQASAMRIEKAAKTLCPYDTGTLRRSISVSQPMEDRGTTYLVGPHTTYDAYVEFGTRHMYAYVEFGTRRIRVYVEFGTRHMHAQPYLRPAYEAEIPRLADAMHKMGIK